MISTAQPARAARTSRRQTKALSSARPALEKNRAGTPSVIDSKLNEALDASPNRDRWTSAALAEAISKTELPAHQLRLLEEPCLSGCTQSSP